MTIDTLIVGAAPHRACESYYAGLLRQARLVIAADAAGEWCIELGRVPDAVVGDFDSSSTDALERLTEAGAVTERHPRDKDETDLDLAITHARRHGARSLTLTAAFAARIDHTLASVGSMLRAADLLPVAREPSFDAYLLTQRHRTALELDVEPGTTVSLLALEPCHGVTIDGMRYPLQDRSLGVLSSIGISNVATEPSVSVRLRHGALLVVLLRDGGSGR